MHTTQMQPLGTGFAGTKLGGRRGFTGAGLRARAVANPSAGRKAGLNVRAEKVRDLSLPLAARRFFCILEACRSLPGHIVDAGCGH